MEHRVNLEALLIKIERLRETQSIIIQVLKAEAERNPDAYMSVLSVVEGLVETAE